MSADPTPPFLFSAPHRTRVVGTSLLSPVHPPLGLVGRAYPGRRQRDRRREGVIFLPERVLIQRMPRLRTDFPPLPETSQVPGRPQVSDDFARRAR